MPLQLSPLPSNLRPRCTCENTFNLLRSQNHASWPTCLFMQNSSHDCFMKSSSWIPRDMTVLIESKTTSRSDGCDFLLWNRLLSHTQQTEHTPISCPWSPAKLHSIMENQGRISSIFIDMSVLTLGLGKPGVWARFWSSRRAQPQVDRGDWGPSSTAPLHQPMPSGLVSCKP